MGGAWRELKEAEKKRRKNKKNKKKQQRMKGLVSEKKKKKECGLRISTPLRHEDGHDNPRNHDVTFHARFFFQEPPPPPPLPKSIHSIVRLTVV